MRDCTGNQDFLGFIEAITAALILVACKLELCRSLINQLIFFLALLGMQGCHLSGKNRRIMFC